VTSNEPVEGSSWLFVQFRYDVQVRKSIVVFEAVTLVEPFVLFENLLFLREWSRSVSR